MQIFVAQNIDQPTFEMKIKLVASDLDGTLLTPAEELPAPFFSLFAQLERLGITFVAASGRQYHNMLTKFSPIADRIYFIAENGAYVVHRNEELLVNGIAHDQMRDLIEQGRKMENGFMVLCGKESAYMERRWSHIFDEAHKYYERLVLVDDLTRVENDIFLKLAIYDPGGAANNGLHFFANRRESHKVTVSGNVWLDVMNKTANKGVALDLVRQRLGVDASEVIAFGDQMNDYEMLQSVRYGYAMTNASNELKATARFIAPSNGDNGVVKVLNELLEELK